jgi:hypothetical protein
VKHIEPVRTGQASAVFAVLTDVRRYYFKTCGALFPLRCARGSAHPDSAHGNPSAANPDALSAGANAGSPGGSGLQLRHEAMA